MTLLYDSEDEELTTSKALLGDDPSHDFNPRDDDAMAPAHAAVGNQGAHQVEEVVIIEEDDESEDEDEYEDEDDAINAIPQLKLDKLADITEDTTEEFKKSMWEGKANILVAVRLRPLLGHDRDNVATVKVLDNKMVVVMDPGKKGDVVGKLRNRSREKRYAFDYVFSPEDGQQKVYQNTTKFLIHGILNGYNATVFAYGCTGAGKTYTMIGNNSDPGIMALTLEDLFTNIDDAHHDDSLGVKYLVHVSFLEVYNENIRDLLAPSSKESLEIREDPLKGPTVAGITEVKVKSSEKVMKLLQLGNRNRSQEATAANAVSSRSHAVLQVIVEQRDKAPGRVSSVKIGKLSMIDLAGSERAAVTLNRGKRLIEGANINRSLLALGNCINALGEKANKSVFVPYRDSKLTRLLKDSLGGNCRTVMIANISMAVSSFEETINTLKYANRAKNIKTKVARNVLNVDYHISEYVSLIDNLRHEITNLKTRLGHEGAASPTTHIERSDNNQLTQREDRSKMREIRQKIISGFRERMQLKRGLIEIENQNVNYSIEIGKQQLVIAQEEKLGEPEDIVSPDEEGSEANDPARMREESSEMHDARRRIEKLRTQIFKNTHHKKKQLRAIRKNEEAAEGYKIELKNVISDEELQELMLLEYRIGKLELENMELEQSQAIHTSIVSGKDLTIQKLRLQLQTRDKIIEMQKNLLQQNHVETTQIDYSRVYDVDDPAMNEGFVNLQGSMERMRTPSSSSHRSGRSRNSSSKRFTSLTSPNDILAAASSDFGKDPSDKVETTSLGKTLPTSFSSSPSSYQPRTGTKSSYDRNDVNDEKQPMQPQPPMPRERDCIFPDILSHNSRMNSLSKRFNVPGHATNTCGEEEEQQREQQHEQHQQQKRGEEGGRSEQEVEEGFLLRSPFPPTVRRSQSVDERMEYASRSSSGSGSTTTTTTTTMAMPMGHSHPWANSERNHSTTPRGFENDQAQHYASQQMQQQQQIQIQIQIQESQPKQQQIQQQHSSSTPTLHGQAKAAFRPPPLLLLNEEMELDEKKKKVAASMNKEWLGQQLRNTSLPYIRLRRKGGSNSSSSGGGGGQKGGSGSKIPTPRDVQSFTTHAATALASVEIQSMRNDIRNTLAANEEMIGSLE